jgi:DNA-binding NtrC family response regulator
MATKVTGEKFAVLVIDDESDTLVGIRKLLHNAGISPVATLDDSREVNDFLARNDVSVIILDLMMPHVTGVELLPQIHTNHPHIPVIVTTASDEIETVVECMRQGASDFIVKPVNVNRLISAVARTLNVDNLRQEVNALKDYLMSDRLSHAESFADIKTRSRRMRAIFQYVEVIAHSAQPVLITGETGVGKEMLARSIHRISDVTGELVSVNVAGLDDPMFSDTLFGHKRGAFTGADQIREGLVCKAAGGTLFLDEIGDLSGLSQVKLLRLIQENEFYPVGSDVIKHCSARLILATNHDLESAIKEGKFRKDLYYRLCCHHIHIPALRDRREDIPLLLSHFIDEAAHQYGKRPPGVSPELNSALTGYDFPGNVRELHAKVFDAVARNVNGILTLRDFPGLSPAAPELAQPAPGEQTGERNGIYSLFGRLPTFREIEEYLIDEALKLSNGNHAAAATLLGITRQTVTNRTKSRNRPEAGTLSL